MKEVMEDCRKSIQSLFPTEEAIFVGWQMHFVIGEVMSSIAGWTNGFKREDYED